MAHCPFCNGEVVTDLVVNGGPCPHCFAQIPGEETPTDPGEEVKVQIQLQDQERAQKRALMPVFVMAPVVALALGIAAFSLRPEERIEEVELDASFSFEFDPVAFDPSSEGASEAQVDAQAPKVGRTAQAGRSTQGSAEPTAEELAERLAGVRGAGAEAASGSRAGDRAPAAQGDRAVASIVATEGMGSSGGDDFSFSASRDSLRVLETEDDIRAAVRALWGERRGQIEQCYERALKADEGFSGTWNLALTVGENGKVSAFEAVAAGAPNAAFEDCIEGRAAGWSLAGRLPKPRTFTLPLNFKPRG